MLNFLHLVFSPPSNSVLYAGSYDPLLVSLSILVAIFASYASLLVSQHVSNTTATTRRLWIAGGGLCFGIGIWSMHFVGMLAFNLPCSSSYDVSTTLLSTIPGILAGTLAIKIISHPEPGPMRLVVGGLLIGIGIGAMHYSGMAAMRLNGLIHYNIKLFLLSIIIAIALAILALWIKFRLQTWLPRLQTLGTIISATVMGLAVSGMHYTAMAAAYFIRIDASSVVDAGITPAFLAAIVLAATSLIIVMTILATYIGKPNLLSFGRSYKLIGILIAAWIGIAWLSADYYYSRLADNLYQQELLLAQQQAEQAASTIDESIKLLKGVSLVLSRNDNVHRALHRFGANARPSRQPYNELKQKWTRDTLLGKLNDSMSIAANNLGADVIWIMNASGDCIASSNYDKPDSFIGTNFVDRDYFRQAKAGKHGHQYAVGRKSKIPGLYYSDAISEKGIFYGTVAVKRNITKFSPPKKQTNIFLADINGVIILAPDRKFEFHSLPNANVGNLSAEQKLLQYRQSLIKPLQILPWRTLKFPAAVLVGGSNLPTVLASKNLVEDGISIYASRPLSDLVRLDNERYWLFILLVAAGSMLIITSSVIVLYLRESHRTASDLRIAATAFESQESVIITDIDGVILRVNSAFTKTTGYTAQEAVGKTPRLLKSGHHPPEFYRAMWETLLRTGTWQGEVWDRRKNGEIYPKWLTISAVKNSDGRVTHYIGSNIDITERKAAEEEIQHLAFYDPLTRLPNRRLLMERLERALSYSARSSRAGALLFIDLDNFKTLNDSLGHDIGDLLLQQVAQRLEPCVRDGDTVARLGGDEFVVVLEGLSSIPMEAAAQTKNLSEKILMTLNQPYSLRMHVHHSTPSIGVTIFHNHLLPKEELMKQADIAMYQAKKNGRNTLSFFDPLMQKNINDRVTMESELHKALEHQQFILHYQIQVDSSMHPLGAEALIRWQHPERGIVTPAQFISLAEETGQIVAIGLWVLQTACARLKLWQDNAHTRDLTLAVNVSARQFRQTDFVAQVQDAVQSYAINPRQLKLELTESLLLENIEDTIATMNALNSIGVQLSLDDFGTGYSSLQYLKKLPLDQLKIDQSFVADIVNDSNDRAIVSTILAMAQSLNLDVIAEGVETDGQRQILLDKGCKRFQGYLFGKPMPIDALEESMTKYDT